jgi:hypothetical protein
MFQHERKRKRAASVKPGQHGRGHIRREQPESAGPKQVVRGEDRPDAFNAISRVLDPTDGRRIRPDVEDVDKPGRYAGWLSRPSAGARSMLPRLVG